MKLLPVLVAADAGGMEMEEEARRRPQMRKGGDVRDHSLRGKLGLNSTATRVEDNLKFAHMLNFPKSTTNTNFKHLSKILAY
jgi:hypothetical protein